jgi:tetratricopeptide (TPR) repeat protein
LLPFPITARLRRKNIRHANILDSAIVVAMAGRTRAEKPGSRGGGDLLGQAQDLVYQAWEIPNLKRRLALAQKALAISPDCADASVLLAEAATSPSDALELYRKGLEAGERAIGQRAFKDDVGSFWGILETRPYMRACAGLAQSLWQDGHYDEAFAHWRDMLRLNLNDDQGIRYVLAARLLEVGRDRELGALLKEYEGDERAYMLWTKALFAFRTQGDNSQSRRVLAEALKSNPHVLPYLLGLKPLPRELPDYTGLGDESEAMALAIEHIKAWQITDGALTRLAETVNPENPSS